MQSEPASSVRPHATPMKFRPRLALAFFSTALATHAAPLTADSKISAVTVYTDRAVVTRTALLDLANGLIEVTFEKLPAALLDQSLQVSGRGAAEAVILDVSARTAYVDFTPNARGKTLEDELRALGKQRRGFDDHTKLLDTQRTSLGYTEAALFAPASKDTARPTVPEITAAISYLAEPRAKISADLAALDEQREALAAKITATEQQLNQLRGAGGRSYKTVTVRLDAKSAGKLDLALSYAVPGASWTPGYDARVTSGERTVALSYFGNVRQNTGEEWKDVALTLSTARPGLGGAAPAMENWNLDIIDVSTAGAVNREYASKEAKSRRAEVVMLALPTLASDAAPKDAEMASATVQSGATSASFRIAASATVPSNNTPQKIPVITAQLSANPEYLTVPKRLAVAYLTSKVFNNSTFPLLAGPMSVFLDGTFVATSALRTVMPGEKFDLALGADEGISVKHKRVSRFTETTGLTNSGQRITYEYLLTIQNNKRTTEHIIVADQIPVSRNEKIVVKQLVPDAKDLKPAADGTLKWTLDLKPGEKRELTLKFSVDHPNDVQVAGLEP